MTDSREEFSLFLPENAANKEWVAPPPRFIDRCPQGPCNQIWWCKIMGILTCSHMPPTTVVHFWILRLVMCDLTLLLTKRDGHQNVGDQFHLFSALLGVLSWSRLVAPLRPSNNFYLIVRGRLYQFPCGPPCGNRLKKVGGSQGYHLSKSTQDT